MARPAVFPLGHPDCVIGGEHACNILCFQIPIPVEIGIYIEQRKKVLVYGKLIPWFLGRGLLSSTRPHPLQYMPRVCVYISLLLGLHSFRMNRCCVTLTSADLEVVMKGTGGCLSNVDLFAIICQLFVVFPLRNSN